MSGSWRHDGAQCTVTMRQVGRETLLLTFAGHVRAADVAHTMPELRASLCQQQGQVDLFVDTANLKHYDSQLRTEGTRVLLDHNKRLRQVLVLVATPLARMGVHVARIVFRKISPVESQAEFQRLLEQQTQARAVVTH